MQWSRSFEQDSPKIIPSPWGLHCPLRVNIVIGSFKFPPQNDQNGSSHSNKQEWYCIQAYFHSRSPIGRCHNFIAGEPGACTWTISKFSNFLRWRAGVIWFCLSCPPTFTNWIRTTKVLLHSQICNETSVIKSG